MQICIVRVMSSIFVVLLSISVCLTTAQWMPYLEPQNMSPFSNPMSDEMIVPKDSSTKIPIILLLKPKRGKSLSADTSSESMDRHHNEPDHQISLDEWLGMPHTNSDPMVSPETHVNQQMSASEYGMSVEPDQEASEEDEVTVRGRGGEQIKWPEAITASKSGVTAEQLASISHLFPKFAAMSAANTETPDMTDDKNTGSMFEDALKKFTSNLTDLEHRKDTEKNVDEEEESDQNSSESTNETQNNSGISGATETLKLDTKESSDDSEKTDVNKNLYSPEERDGGDQRLSPQKSKPLRNERNRIRIPVKSELNQQKSNPVIHTVVGQPSHKGWVPIKNKSHKPKRKPKPSSNVIRFPSEASPASGYLYHNSDRHPYGMPEPLNMIATAEPPPHLFRPRHFPHSFIPYDTKHTISQLPYHKYTSYLTDPEMTPSLMEMTADANKPQHIEPTKVGEEAALTGADKLKDVIEQKEQMIDNKHVINEKQMIVDEKHAIHGLGGLGGEELLGQHMTCCDILNGGHNGPHHVIHEEVIHKPDFDDDKLIAGMGIPEPFHKQEFPLHFGPGFGSAKPSFGSSKFGLHFPQHQGLFPKKQCNQNPLQRHDTFPTTYEPTYWPPKVYRRPVYRPKLFYKPLLFG